MTQNKKTTGYSLAEMIVVIALTALLMVVVSGSIAQFYQNNSYTIQQSAAVSNGRNAITELVQDLREATESDGGAYALVSIAADDIEFYSDIDRDDNVEKAHYYIDSEKRLVRDTVEPSGDPIVYTDSPSQVILADYIRNEEQSVDLFSYFDEDGTEITDLSNVSDVRFIRIDLVVNVDPLRQPDEFNIHSSALLRNLDFVLE